MITILCLLTKKNQKIKFGILIIIQCDDMLYIPLFIDFLPNITYKHES